MTEVRRNTEVRRAISILMSISEPADFERPDVSFGEIIATARTRLRLSLQDVADACHISKTHIHDLEQERSTNPSAALVWNLSQLLLIDPAYLLEKAAKPKLANPREAP